MLLKPFNQNELRKRVLELLELDSEQIYDQPEVGLVAT
jgi:hypothetical protein